MAKDASTMELPTLLTWKGLLCGRFLPGRMWSEPGAGLLWAESSADSEVLESLVMWLAKTHRVAASRRVSGTTVQFEFRGSDFVFALLYAIPLLSNAALSPELAWYVRGLRLALVMVEQQDIVPYAAPAELTSAQITDTCLRLSASDEDGWMEWSSHTEAFSAAWLPAWMRDRARALRSLLLSEAEATWGRTTVRNQAVALDSYNSALPLGSEDATDSQLLDVWLWKSVDAITRTVLTDIGRGEKQTRSKYQISYRGEDDATARWMLALKGPADRSQFAADGWLMWRTLRQFFTGTGWHSKWLRDRSGQAYYHLEFELIPPSRDGAAREWRLEYYIAHNVWSYRAPLAEWWRTPARRWNIGKDVLHGPDEWILPALWSAGGVFDPIANSLRQAGPASCVIPPDMVFDFVTAKLPLLRELGIVVRTPVVELEDIANIRVRVQVKRSTVRTANSKLPRKSTGLFEADQLVDFDWTLVIEDMEVSREEFETMVERQMPYLQLGGSWRLIPMQVILEQVQLLGGVEQSNPSVNLLQFARSVLINQGEEAEASAIQVDVAFEDEAIDAARTLDVLTHANQPVVQPPPVSFRGQLRQYQTFGYSWLLHLRQIGCGGCLADDMGLGKTIQVLAYLLQLKETKQSRGVHLLLCPTSLLQNWKSEIVRFAPDLQVHIHHGSARNQPGEDGKTPLAGALERVDLVITTYATAVRDFETLCEVDWDVVVADEAQNIKNAETKQSQAVRKLPARHRIALTGTPVENRLEELWSIFHFTNPGYLGSLNWFRKVFAGPIASHPQSPVSRQLHNLLRPVLLRRRKTEPSIQMELPEKWEVNQYAGLSAEQAALYQSIVNRLFLGIDGAKSAMSRRGQILASLVRLKQVCDHPCLVVGGNNDTKRSGKLKLLLDLLEDVVSEGESALIFTQFRDMGELLRSALNERFGWKPQFLHGGLTASVRGQIVDTFQSGADPSPVLVLSLKAGGVGLNLTRANHVFHFDRWWNPAVEDQATDRVFRIGQTRDVQVHKLVCSGTLEERIDALIRSKRALSAAVVGESEGWVTELDNDTLRQLFALDADASVEDEE